MAGAGSLIGIAAIYEAGRAVAASCLGFTVESVSINSSPDLGGDTEILPTHFDALNSWTEKKAVFAAAGEQSMLQVLGSDRFQDLNDSEYLSVKAIADVDIEKLRRTASWMMCIGAEPNDFVEWARTRAFDLVSNNFEHVVNLGAAILQNQRVSGPELDLLLKGPFDTLPWSAKESYSPDTWRLPSRLCE